MNKERRRELRVAITRLEEAYEHLNEVLADEQDAFDNLPEGLQASERGEEMEEGISTMEDALESLDEIRGSLEELM